MGRSPLALALITVLAAGFLFSVDAARTTLEAGRKDYRVKNLIAPGFDKMKFSAPDPVVAGRPNTMTLTFRNTGLPVEDGVLHVKAYYYYPGQEPVAAGSAPLGRVWGTIVRTADVNITFPHGEMSYTLVIAIDDRSPSSASKHRLIGAVPELQVKSQSASNSNSSAIKEQSVDPLVALAGY